MVRLVRVAAATPGVLCSIRPRPVDRRWHAAGARQGSARSRALGAPRGRNCFLRSADAEELLSSAALDGTVRTATSCRQTRTELARLLARPGQPPVNQLIEHAAHPNVGVKSPWKSPTWKRRRCGFESVDIKVRWILVTSRVRLSSVATPDRGASLVRFHDHVIGKSLSQLCARRRAPAPAARWSAAQLNYK